MDKSLAIFYTTELKTYDLVKFTDDTLPEVIIDNLSATPDTPINTQTVYEDHRYTYQLLSLDYLNNSKDMKTNCNADILCPYVKLYGVCILIKSEITHDRTCIPASIEAHDIDMLFKVSTEFTYLHVPVDTINTSNITEHVVKTYNELQVDLMKSHTINIRGFELIIYYKEDAPVNKYISKFINKEVYGDVKIISVNNGMLTDLTCDLLRQLIRVPLDKRAVKAHEVDEKQINNKQVIINKYTLLHDVLQN